MSTGTPTNEENAKIETQLLTVETKKKKMVEVNQSITHFFMLDIQYVIMFCFI